MLMLKNNPFYILGVSPEHNRLAIIAKVEEKSFLCDDGRCEIAQSLLLNPSRRLAAELDWFLDVDSQTLFEINSCIDANKIMFAENLSPLSKINALLFNVSVMDSLDVAIITNAIIDIDQQFSLVNVAYVTELVNRCREKSGMRTATEVEVNQAVQAKRSYISRFLSDKLILLPDEMYISLMSSITENTIYNDNFKYGLIVTDLLDQYEIRMKSVIDDYTETIIGYIANVKEHYSDDDIHNNLQDLIDQVAQWHLIIHPLQRRAARDYMPNNNIVEIGFSLRDLALFLHNERNLTDVSLKLISEIQPLFVGMGELTDKIKEDKEALTIMLKNDEEIDNIIEEIERFQQQADKMIWMHDYDIEPFWEKIKILNALIQNSNIAQNSKLDLRKTVCSIARNATIKHYNQFPEIAAAISYRTIVRLEQAFYDIPDVYEKLKQDATQLKEQALIQKQNFERQMSKSSRPGGCYIATCVYGSYDCPQVWTLRRFRDRVLGSTWYGRLFIRIYYRVSPILVKLFGKTNWFKKTWRGKLDKIVKELHNQGFSSTPYVDKNWK